MKSIIGGLIVGTIGYISLRLFGNYHVFGVGYDFLDLVLDNKITALVMAFALIFLKLLANSLTLASGGSGGIFAPSLFLGGCLRCNGWHYREHAFPRDNRPYLCLCHCRYGCNSLGCHWRSPYCHYHGI